jgi:hypothetical protein
MRRCGSGRQAEAIQPDARTARWHHDLGRERFEDTQESLRSIKRGEKAPGKPLLLDMPLAEKVVDPHPPSPSQGVGGQVVELGLCSTRIVWASRRQGIEPKIVESWGPSQVKLVHPARDARRGNDQIRGGRVTDQMPHSFEIAIRPGLRQHAENGIVKTQEHHESCQETPAPTSSQNLPGYGLIKVPNASQDQPDDR